MSVLLFGQVADELVVGTQPVERARDFSFDDQQAEQVLALIGWRVAIQEGATAEPIGEEDRQVGIRWRNP
jgi:hypothetical protein